MDFLTRENEIPTVVTICTLVGWGLGRRLPIDTTLKDTLDIWLSLSIASHQCNNGGLGRGMSNDTLLQEILKVVVAMYRTSHQYMISMGLGLNFLIQNGSPIIYPKKKRNGEEEFPL